MQQLFQQFGTHMYPQLVEIHAATMQGTEFNSVTWHTSKMKSH